jgi:hypothetical protein
LRQLREPEQDPLLDLLDPERPATCKLDLGVTIRIELERRARGLEHRPSAGKRPETAFALEPE